MWPLLALLLNSCVLPAQRSCTAATDTGPCVQASCAATKETQLSGGDGAESYGCKASCSCKIQEQRSANVAVQCPQHQKKPLANEKEATTVSDDPPKLRTIPAEQDANEASAATPPFNEWLVVTFHVRVENVFHTAYYILVMTVYASPANVSATSSKPCARVLPDDPSVAQVIVPHEHGKIRNVRLRSSCIQRVKRAPLDSLWPIEPSWCCEPMTFESPVSISTGGESLCVAVDDEDVFSVRFQVDGHSVSWSTLAIPALPQ